MCDKEVIDLQRGTRRKNVHGILLYIRSVPVGKLNWNSLGSIIAKESEESSPAIHSMSLIFLLLTSNNATSKQLYRGPDISRPLVAPGAWKGNVNRYSKQRGKLREMDDVCPSANGPRLRRPPTARAGGRYREADAFNTASHRVLTFHSSRMARMIMRDGSTLERVTTRKAQLTLV